MDKITGAVLNFMEQVNMSAFRDENGHALEDNDAYCKLMVIVSEDPDFKVDEKRSKEPGRFFEAVEGRHMFSYEEFKRQMEERSGLILEPHEYVEKGYKVREDAVICPTYMTEKAVGADAFASEEVIIQPGEVKAVPLGVKAKFPGAEEGLFAFVRSSVPGKKKLMLANGVGVIEEDYYGNPKNDGELGLLFYNFGSEAVTIKRFERVGQLALLPISRFDNAGNAGKERGESGSTN